jgi:3-oxoacyl-[acyl-carrier protein] reductase
MLTVKAQEGIKIDMGQINFAFKNKNIVVTGGASGIGLEITLAFLKAGAQVAVWDYSEKMLAHAQTTLAEYKSQLHFAAVDVSSRSQLQAATEKLPWHVDVLVNNAGITRDKSFAKMTAEDWDSVISINITGLFNVTKSLLEKFNSQSKQKRIVNISSVVGLYGNFGQANYASAKAGVIGFTKTLGKELGRKGFTVNAVAPGFIQTPMTEAMPAEALQKMAAQVPVQRLGSTVDISNAVLFLSSEEASYINASVISVDGGIVL